MLAPEVIQSVTGISDEQKKTLALGEVAESLMNSPAWGLILDWAEARANRSLSKLKDCAYADPAIQTAWNRRWRDDEDWLKDLQVYIKGLVIDRDSLLDTYARVVQDMKVNDLPGYSEPNSASPEAENPTNGKGIPNA